MSDKVIIKLLAIVFLIAVIASLLIIRYGAPLIGHNNIVFYKITYK